MHRTQNQEEKVRYFVSVFGTRIFGFTEVNIIVTCVNVFCIKFSYRNKGTKTVEEELLLALKSNNLITDEGFDQIQTMNFQRAARTDKGVSALRQIISLLLRESVYM